MKRSISFQIAAFIAVRIVVNTALRMLFPFLPVFGRGMGVDLATLSSALALRSAAGILGPFMAPLADRRGRKVGMLAGLAIFILGSSLVALWPTFPVFVLGITLNLLGYFLFNPSMQAYLGDRVPYQQRGLALALTELGWSLSFIIGVPLVGLLIARYGWSAPFAVLAILGLAALLALARILPGGKPASVSGVGAWRTLGRVFSSPIALAGMIMGSALSMANELVNLVFGVWLEDAFGLQIAALGATAALIGFSELGGEALSAGLVDRLGKSRAITIGLLVNSLAGLVLVFSGGQVAAAMAGLFLFYLSFEFTMVCTIPLMTEVLPEARATMMASYVAMISLGRAGGDLLSPRLYNLSPFSSLLAIALAVALFNFISWLALNFLKRRQEANRSFAV